MPALSFTRWLDLVGDRVAKAKEQETGIVSLTFFDEDQQQELLSFFMQGMTPKEATKEFLAP